MADLAMDVDAALAKVPVNVMPLIDDGDFKTIEASVAYNAGGLTLVWNFAPTGGTATQTAVTPTTSGTYDWTNLGNGMYAIEIPASGGASINNDTEGIGWFTGVASGVLPWRGPFIVFRSAALNDSLIDAGATGLLAPTVAARTLDVSAAGNAGIDWANIDAPTTAQNLSATTISTSQVVASVTAGVTLAAAAIAAIWDRLTSALTTSGSIGKLLVDNINATISSRLAPTVAARTLDVSAAGNAGIDWSNIEAPTTTQNLSGTTVAAVTGDVGGIGANGIDAASFAAGAIDDAAVAASAEDAIADAFLLRDLATGSSASDRNVQNALRPSRNRVIISQAGSVTVYEEDDTTPAWTGTATRDATADPITQINPS